jgi:hypothetical protein
MNGKNDILEELESMESSLARLPRTMPYSVPVGYFANFPGETWKTLQLIGEPEAVRQWGKALPYSVPQGYFEDLAGQVLAKTLSKDVMPGLPAGLPFTAPLGYFETLPQQLLQAAKQSEPAVKRTVKKIPLGGSYTIRSVRWAAAAILILFVGLGGVYYFNQPASESEKILASVPRNEIQDYLQHTYRIDMERVDNNDISSLHVDSKEIIQYLNETGWDVAE